MRTRCTHPRSTGGSTTSRGTSFPRAISTPIGSFAGTRSIPCSLTFRSPSDRSAGRMWSHGSTSRVSNMPSCTSAGRSACAPAFTFPLHGPGSRVDLMSLSLRNEREVPLHRLPFLYALTVQFWLRHGELTEKREVRSSEIPHLTKHELECLTWCKEGKTNWEIGELMNISEKTVEWHLS